MKNAIWLNEYFRQALEASPIGQLIVDNQGIIRHINRKMAELFGYHEAELRNQELETLIPQGMRSSHLDYRTQYFKNPVVRTMGSGRILFGLHKTGAQIPVEIGLNPLSDRSEQYVLASVVDISERVKSERQFQLALEASPSGLILIDDKGKILLVNMSQEVLDNMYDPFFTTKFTGRGLGMASVLGIIRSHMSGIAVRSEPNAGTSIKIIFPVRPVMSSWIPD